MRTELEVFSDLSERLDYNLPNFQLYVRKGPLHQFDRYAAACHWHPDLEFILVLDGSMNFFVNGNTVHIDEGKGIFVNSKRLHYAYSPDMTDCSFIVVAIHPSLIGRDTWEGKEYWEEKFGPNSEDYLLLTDQLQWQREVLQALNQIYNEMHSTARNPFRLLSQAMAICAYMGDHLKEISGHLANDQLSATIWKMTGFIHQHYENKIMLDDIAAAGSVCRSRCCELLGHYVGQSPNSYLIRYRIQKSCEMLQETDRTISEIASSSGFQSASYFSYAFRKEIGVVPQAYRKKHRFYSDKS
ncbi:AraC family transcriptional regulator [Paenibacillus macquariensis]|uniref:AraC-type DNA-binding protein n=1 Tax=Paenibacillus macquariensis TaxID=948756 RepID=A0ABY1JYY2_9BACL|nr:AraC family transcriptional regulator [Paenibacillus macquariensis]MEC0093906.1 AraC family transcriptional regulator [Paenibacillus macquariensis]OAB29244.1 AraC family transcriptional regulator [Paenibacillus macquariensis subsp. macquariensis]SIR01644.1 AraC-type DNA-binding protein [Paenibacillus macquariensis]